MRITLGLLVLTLAACSTTSGVTNGMVHGSPCANDLTGGGYVTDAKEAERYCAQSSPAEITIAEQLKDGHYTATFAEGLEKSKGLSEKQLACAKAEHDADGRVFSLSEACRAM